ncbi:kinase-like domain-containing protein, partial [Mycena olivaceomarginata]
HVLPFFRVYNLNTRLCLASLWMEAGDIMELITAKEPTFAECFSLILDVAFGLQYLHEEKIVHRNLEVFNILVTPSDRACIADFRLPRISRAINVGFNCSTANAGTTHYQAPELFKPANLA